MFLFDHFSMYPGVKLRFSLEIRLTSRNAPRSRAISAFNSPTSSSTKKGLSRNFSSR
jgi:hypothetical protein